MSVVPDTEPVLVPPLWAKTTTSAPFVSWLPLASLAVKVSVTVAPDVTVAELRVTSDWLSDTAPGLTVKVGSVEVTAEPPMVALMVVALPDVKPVNVAVYVPLPTSVVPEIVPVLTPPL